MGSSVSMVIDTGENLNLWLCCSCRNKRVIPEWGWFVCVGTCKRVPLEPVATLSGRVSEQFVQERDVSGCSAVDSGAESLDDLFDKDKHVPLTSALSGVPAGEGNGDVDAHEDHTDGCHFHAQ